VLFLQIRGLSDWILRAGDWWVFRTLTGFPEEASNWIQQLQRPGRLVARLNFYRANLGMIVPKPWSKVSKVPVPVMGVFSDGDRFLAEAQMTGTQEFVDGPWRYERVEGTNHGCSFPLRRRSTRCRSNICADRGRRRMTLGRGGFACPGRRA
jgi:hypothetical protein